MAEANNMTRGSPRNQSMKVRNKKEPTPVKENASFLELIRNSESSSSLRCRSNPYKASGSSGNLSARRFSNETHIPVNVNNGCPPNRPYGRVPIHKANSVDCGDHLPSIVVDKALDDLEFQPKETDKLLPEKFQRVEEKKETDKPVCDDYVVLSGECEPQAETIM